MGETFTAETILKGPAVPRDAAVLVDCKSAVLRLVVCLTALCVPPSDELTTGEIESFDFLSVPRSLVATGAVSLLAVFFL